MGNQPTNKMDNQSESRDIRKLLGGPWDLVITYSWAYNPTYNPPKWAYRGYPNDK